MTRSPAQPEPPESPASAKPRVSTGLGGLDAILDGLRLGDNVVWSLDRIDDFAPFVQPFVEQALREQRRVVYLRYANHAPLVTDERVQVYQLDALRGFEPFVRRVHAIITEEGRGVFYVFDCLSDLLLAWATDQMIGNFFRVTCPYLYELDTVGYFALLRGSHALKTLARIRDTTQVLLGVRQVGDEVYVQPVKVWQRRSPTMFLPHRRVGERFAPLANSHDATELLSHLAHDGPRGARQHLDHWDRLFMEAEDLAQQPGDSAARAEMVDRLCRVMVGRDERMLALADRYFSLDDLLAIKARLIGTGFIGGKAVGMLLARRVLLSDAGFDWDEHLEPHDSFFVGSDVFHSFLVHNGLWPLLMKQRSAGGYYTAAAELRRRIRQGTFPEEVGAALRQMLEYFGQYPIIIRSSSLLEDSFGNAFAGKYASVFRVNQGTPEQRCAQVQDAIREVFASALSEDALAYRRQRGLDQADEQMALLIQRVSGVYREHYYFPDLAGVGISVNTCPWSPELDPAAGMLRLVLGLGTRAVDRVEDDYPRLVALDAPQRKPYHGPDAARRFTQRDVDVLNLEANQPQTVSVAALRNGGLDIDWRRLGEPDHEARRRLEERGRSGEVPWLLDFDRLLGDDHFAPLMRRMLKTLERAYGYPVDVEFTANFRDDGEGVRINPVQCRPLQTRGARARVHLPDTPDPARVFLASRGHFMGGNVDEPLEQVIWIDPAVYSGLPVAAQHEVARLVGRLNRRIGEAGGPRTMLLGPGRWGTSTPSLGVGVRFAEINHMTALGEVAFSRGGLMPELSFGTHFFLDLVETGIFYLALFPDEPGCRLDTRWLLSLPNELPRSLTGTGAAAAAVRVCRVPEVPLRLMADVVSQRVVCLRGGA